MEEQEIIFGKSNELSEEVEPTEKLARRERFPAANTNNRAFKHNFSESMKHIISQAGASHQKTILKATTNGHDRDQDKTVKKFGKMMKRV